MKKVYAWLSGSALLLTSMFISESCSKSTEESDDLIGNWVKSSDFGGDARSEAVTFTIGDSVYICAGTTDRDRFKDLWVYSISRQYWSQRADLPAVARNSGVGFSINGKGYVGIGYDGTNKLNDFWEYNPSTNSWTQKDNFGGSARYDAVSFVVSNKGYVSCGFDGNYLLDLWQFDPSAAPGNQWVQKASIGRKRSAAQAFVLNDKAYVVSGNNNGTSLNDLWMYDPASDSWTEKRKISNVSDEDYDDDYSISRSNGVTFVMGNNAYITCGENGSILSTAWKYDSSTDLWEQKTGFEGSARVGAVAFTLNNRGFVLTGRSGSLSFDNMYEFDPSAEQNDDDN